MPTYSLLPNAKMQFLDGSGNPLASGRIYFYVAGTSTPLATYTDSGGLTQNSNPVILDSAGRADIWLISTSAYKIVVKNAADVLQWSVDNIINIGQALGRDLIDWTLVGLGDAMIAYKEPVGSGTVNRTVHDRFTDLSFNAKDFGADDTGIADATTAITNMLAAAQSTGARMVFSPGIYRFNSKILANKNNILWDGYGVTLRFQGVITERLLHLTGDKNIFRGFTFSGNNSQPYGSLVYIDDNTDDPQFIDCTFKDISATTHGLNMTNNVAAVSISPYGVTNYAFKNCRFQNITSDNTAGVAGVGFVGGIFHFKYDPGSPETLNPGTTAQTVYTSGTIDGCVFDTIQTILSGGLSAANVASFDDGDSIRGTGVGYDGVGVNRLDIRVQNCRFNKVSKRAIKFSGVSGLMAFNNEVIADQGAYSMISIIKMYGNSVVDGLKVYSGLTKYPILGIQLETIQNTVISNVVMQAGGYFLDFNDTSSPATPQRNLMVSNVACDNLADGGINSSTTLPTSSYMLTFANVQLRMITDIGEGIETPLSNSNTDGKIRLYNVEIINGDVKIQGKDCIVDGLHITIDRAGFTGSVANRPLLEFGITGATNYNILRNVHVDVQTCSATYLNATRTKLINVIGDNTTVQSLSIRVPATINDLLYPHASFSGSHCMVDGVSYYGHGFIKCGTTATSGSVYRNFSRLGHGVAAAIEFILTDTGATYCAFQNITDFRTTSVVTLNIPGGGPHVVDGVVSLTTNAEIGFDTFATVRNDFRLTNIIKKYQDVLITANGQTVSSLHETIFLNDTTGGHTGLILSAPTRPNQTLVLIATTGTADMTFIESTTAVFRAGAPRFGIGSADVSAMILQSSGTLWYEVSRSTIP